MLSPADDYPLHQRPEPFMLAGRDRNFYDRFFFNGYNAQSTCFFALALGIYPQLGIMDAAFSVRVGDKQYNLRASKEMTDDRLNMQIGAIRLAIVRPMQETRIEIADNEWGLSGSLVAHAAHVPIEEPRFTRRQGARVMMDVTRATQNIHWQGHIDCANTRHDVDGFFGTRDRSWGIRQIGAGDAQPLVPAHDPQFYWLWAPSYLLPEGEDFAPAAKSGAHLFIHTNDDGEGVGWNRHAQLLDSPAVAAAESKSFKAIDFQLAYVPGTRRVDTLTATLADDTTLTLTRFGQPFYMQGLGYLHPTWGHGMHHAPSDFAGDKSAAMHFDVLDLTQAEADLEKGQLHNVHIQQPMRARLTTPQGVRLGYGALEQLLLGAHAPSGFRDILDGAR